MPEKKRFTRAFPCPICGGGDDMKRGAGLRCHGFLAADGRYAHCARVEPAGVLQPEAGGTFAHRLDGPCKCGAIHDPERAADAERLRELERPARVARTLRYEVKDAAGEVVAVHVRRELESNVKKMFWQGPDGSRGLGGRPVAELPLYRLPELVMAPPESHVVVVEGEKAADALAALGACSVVGTITGAASCPADEVLRPLVGRAVYLWPDHDDAGRGHMSKIAAGLARLGVKARWIAWGEEDGDDAADFVLGGGGAAALRELLEAAGDPPSSEPDDGTGDAVEVALTRMADVTPQPVLWLWPGRIPLGKITILDGDPGLGKSTVTLDLAARVSTGREMPDGTRGDLAGAAGVVILSAEDDPADTIRPRLDSAGADVTLVSVLEGVRIKGKGVAGRTTPPVLRPPTLGDVAALRAAITETGARLVVVDPLMAYLDADAHVDGEVRARLAPLAKLAAGTGAAVLVVRHLNKSGGSKAIYRGGGSIGISAAARSALLVAEDPDDPEGRVLAAVKSNLAARSPSLKYRIDPAGSSILVTWGGTSDRTANDLLSVAEPGERSAEAGAEEFLRAALADGPRPQKEIEREARQAGIADRTLERVKERLGVHSDKTGFGGPWYWQLPEVPPSPTVGSLRPKCGITNPNGRSAEGRQAETLAVFAGDALRACLGAVSPKAANAVKGGRPRPVETPAPPCQYPDHSRWRSVHGATFCVTCNPPAAPELVAEWITAKPDAESCLEVTR